MTSRFIWAMSGGMSYVRFRLFSPYHLGFPFGGWLRHIFSFFSSCSGVVNSTDILLEGVSIIQSGLPTPLGTVWGPFLTYLLRAGLALTYCSIWRSSVVPNSVLNRLV